MPTSEPWTIVLTEAKAEETPVTTMKDVARVAGVSAKTVSRVFRGDDYVSEAARERVTQAMEQLNYLPNAAATTFRTGRAPLLAIAVPDISDPFFAEITKAVDQVARPRGYTLIVTSLGEHESDEPAIVETLLRHQVSGLIIAPTSSDQRYLKRWVEQLPVVFVDREPRNVSADLFIEDDRGGAETAVRHLIELGHRRILFVGDSIPVITSSRRWEGYKDALSAAGLPVEDDLALWVKPTEAAAQITQLLSRSAAPTGIFSSNSRTSSEIYPALQRLGRDDVALVSFGDFPMASALSPQVTVVDQNPEQLGQAAAKRLLDRLDHPQRRYRRKNVLDVGLIVRDAEPDVEVSHVA